MADNGKGPNGRRKPAAKQQGVRRGSTHPNAGRKFGRPFPKGVSGNPGGRAKKGDAWADILARLGDREVEVRRGGRVAKMPYREAIAEAMMIKASQGDVRAARWVADREVGRPLQPIAAEVRGAYDMTELYGILEIDDV